MDKEYSNREIDLMFKEIQETLGRIEVQTSKTNGRVSNLERWRSGIIMALSVISFIVIPLVLYASNLQHQYLEQEIISKLQSR